MKRFALLLCLIACTSLFGFSAQPTKIDLQVSALQKEIAPLIANRAGFRSREKNLLRIQEEIKFGVEAYNKVYRKLDVAIPAFNIEADMLDKDVAAYKQEVAAHNANQCVTTTRNPDACRAYEAEAARINSRRGYLEGRLDERDAKKRDLIETRRLNEELKATLVARTEQWAADVKRWTAENADNEAKINAVRKKIAVLNGQQDNCIEALGPKASMERMHEVCGQPFDGNGNFVPVVNQGTGGATRNQ